MRSGGWHFWAMLALLLFGGAVVNVWERAGEAHVERRQLAEFPSRLGEWSQRGADARFTPDVEAVLRADDYLSRDYALPDGRAANFYVGYYATQRNGATYHSPLNCLPGSGWTMRDGALVHVTPAGGGKPFEANRYIVENGDDRQLLIYWYQGRGRAVASEYWGKIYTVLDSLERRRSDGAMVRVMVPFRGDEGAALRTAEDLAAQAAPHLSAFVPD
ncbi:MAG: EpsI family protein [Acidobacteria bacterium]|nr:EpsI family protein [Acidobacteriota bacterium]